MAGLHMGVLALICSCLLVLPSWSDNNQTDVDDNNEDTTIFPTMDNNDDIPFIKERNAILPSWTQNKTTDVQPNEEERNSGEPKGNTRMGKMKKTIKKRNEKEKKYKNKNISTKIATCPSGWTSLTTGCYRFLPETGDARTLEEAKTACQSQGGFVVEVNSQNEQDALRQFWKSSGQSGQWVWIGATDQAKEGEWRWINSGQKMTFTSWYSGEPNNSGNEDCVIAGWMPWHDFNWVDVGCGYNAYIGHKALCEYPGGPACTGTQSDLSCCKTHSCQEKQGDCDSDSECAGSLVCGKDNCKDFNPLAHSVADCCITKPGTGGSSDWGFCSSTSPCKEKQGDCDSDSDCAASLVCGINNCKNFHPLAAYSADCCIRKPGTGGPSDWEFCSATSPCNEQQGDCDSDSDCAASLVCGTDNCKDFHPSAQGGTDCCIRPKFSNAWTKRVKIFTDQQCRNLGNSPGNDIAACKKLCDQTKGCNAINHGWYCTMRACPVPIPEPTSVYSGYNSYFKSGDGACYSDSPRLLDNYRESSTNTPDECKKTCSSLGYSYAGVQYTKECWCGNDSPPASRIVDSSECDMICSGDAAQICGGAIRMNIYKTG